jgi:hypothetical protein
VTAVSLSVPYYSIFLAPRFYNRLVFDFTRCTIQITLQVNVAAMLCICPFEMLDSNLSWSSAVPITFVVLRISYYSPEIINLLFTRCINNFKIQQLYVLPTLYLCVV